MSDGVPARQVPPPTRGWSSRLPRAPGGVSGSPAHAGMVLRKRCPGGAHPRFPRPRGDGPSSSGDSSLWARVPPPTRGWSREGAGKIREVRGSPAHAGMVPARPRISAGFSRFPRPRGDGPLTPSPRVSRRSVPPPTRGWSARHHPVEQSGRGSPAHAGMVPAEAAPADVGAWFPRPRGDGPFIRLVLNRIDGVPPPTRGWSVGPQAHAASQWGSPAHAGMVPRARHHRPGALGSPAHAGMVLVGIRAVARDLRFPRPRGDGPRLSAGLHAEPPVPPPTRGWSRTAAVRLADVDGSPAHAGMVPPGSRS